MITDVAKVSFAISDMRMFMTKIPSEWRCSAVYKQYTSDFMNTFRKTLFGGLPV